MSNDFFNQVEKAQDLAEIFLKLPQEQQEEIYNLAVNERIKSEYSTMENVKKEAYPLVQLLKQMSPEQKMILLEKIKSLQKEIRSKSNVSIGLKLDV